jgi:hypothetical protein
MAQITNIRDSSKVSPFWEASSCAATQDFSNIFVKVEGSLPCPPEISSVLYPKFD